MSTPLGALRIRDVHGHLKCSACGVRARAKASACDACRASFVSRDRPNRIEAPDHCSLDGATKLAARIIRYWQEHGIKITTSVEPVGLPHDLRHAHNEGRIYAVRSNAGAVAL